MHGGSVQRQTKEEAERAKDISAISDEIRATIVGPCCQSWPYNG